MNMIIAFSYAAPDFSNWQGNATLLAILAVAILLLVLAIKVAGLVSKVIFVVLAFVLFGGSLPIRNVVFEKFNKNQVEVRDRARQECVKFTGSKVGEGQCDF
jgi:hypothetical protein